MDEQAIIAAISRFNEELSTWPDSVRCSLEGLYPDFDDPDCGPEMYLALVEEAAREVKAKIDIASEGQDDALKRLLAMLVKCATTLRLAGITSPSGDDQQDASSEHLAGEAETSDKLYEPPGINGHHPTW